jgi:pimeloyl-ACP methyl ester carboxylesterase
VAHFAAESVVGCQRNPQLMQLTNKIGAALHWTGAVRAIAASYEKMTTNPEYDDRAVKAYVSTSFGSILKENDALEQTLAEAGTFRQLGHRPVFVLTAMAPMPEQAQSQEIWKQMQNELATWSSQSQHQLIPDAGHYIQFDRPDIVIAAVRSVVENVRAKRHR